LGNKPSCAVAPERHKNNPKGKIEAQGKRKVDNRDNVLVVSGEVKKTEFNSRLFSYVNLLSQEENLEREN